MDIFRALNSLLMIVYYMSGKEDILPTVQSIKKLTKITTKVCCEVAEKELLTKNNIEPLFSILEEIALTDHESTYVLYVDIYLKVLQILAGSDDSILDSEIVLLTLLRDLSITPEGTVITSIESYTYVKMISIIASTMFKNMVNVCTEDTKRASLCQAAMHAGSIILPLLQVDNLSESEERSFWNERRGHHSLLDRCRSLHLNRNLLPRLRLPKLPPSTHSIAGSKRKRREP